MATGLVLEGGAMQGMYTAGVLDTFMEKGISFDGIVGVSAGALFGVNILSGQKGRAIRYNKKYNRDRNYMGVMSLVKTGDIINEDYAYRRVPFELDPFDDETFKRSMVPFYAVVTNINTGEPEYIQIKSVLEQMDTLRASGSMPYVSTPVNINGNLYLDGAVADSIPFKFMMDSGYDKLVVVLTKSIEYVKKPLPKRLCNLIYRKKYPLFADKVINRHNMYNKQIKDLYEKAQKGTVEIIRPSVPLYIKKLERDPKEMQRLYDLGCSDALKWLETTEININRI